MPPIIRKAKKRGLFEPFVLAASGKSRCTTLVCSCYEPSRCSDYKGSDQDDNKNKGKNQDGVMGEEDQEACNDRFQSQGKINDGPPTDPTPLKSNLKKTSNKVEVNDDQPRMIVARKVNWPDAHGRDIAHVQEFETSVREDGKLGAVQSSCVCAIQ